MKNTFTGSAEDISGYGGIALDPDHAPSNSSVHVDLTRLPVTGIMSIGSARVQLNQFFKGVAFKGPEEFVHFDDQDFGIGRVSGYVRREGSDFVVRDSMRGSKVPERRFGQDVVRNHGGEVVGEVIVERFMPPESANNDNNVLSF